MSDVTSPSQFGKNPAGQDNGYRVSTAEMPNLSSTHQVKVGESAKFSDTTQRAAWARPKNPFNKNLVTMRPNAFHGTAAFDTDTLLHPASSHPNTID